MIDAFEEVIRKYSEKYCEKYSEIYAQKYQDIYANLYEYKYKSEITQRMLQHSSLSLDEIADYLDFPIEMVKSIAKGMENKQPQKSDH